MPSIWEEGDRELRTMQALFNAAGYGPDASASTLRRPRLEYYTGPVFEIELTFKVQNEKGQDVVFGSVGGGGRYDGLVSASAANRCRPPAFPSASRASPMR